MQTFMKMPVELLERPTPRLPDDKFPNLRGHQEAILCLGTLLYAAVRLFGWNYDFPTLGVLLRRMSCMFFIRQHCRIPGLRDYGRDHAFKRRGLTASPPPQQNLHMLRAAKHTLDVNNSRGRRDAKLY